MTGSEDSPLTKAIHRQSHEELRSCLNSVIVQNSDQETRMSLHIAANWPLGLQTLLQYGFTEISQQTQLPCSPLDWAIMLGNAQSAKLLMHNLAFFTSETWYLAVMWDNSEILIRVALGLYQRSQLSVKNSLPRKLPYEYRSWSTEPIDIANLYQQRAMSIKAVQALYTAGFTTIDHESTDNLTPLTYHAGLYEMTDAPTILWFLEKGARLDPPHLLGITPLHLLAASLVVRFIRQGSKYEFYKNRMGWDSFETLDRPFVWQPSTPEICSQCYFEEPEGWPPQALTAHCKIFTTVFESDLTDYCTCHCTLNGCSPTTIALKASIPSGCMHQVTLAGRSTTQLQRRTLHEIITYHTSLAHHIRIDIEALRIMTFDALGLTHTCCDWHGCPPFSRRPSEQSFYSAEEVEDVRYAEADDINLLESLMVEFKNAWGEWRGGVLDFINDIWSARIEGVMADREAPRMDEVRRLAEVGVVVGAQGPELPSLDEVEVDMSPQALFEREVRKILSGDY
jgi:hypothetical protein